MSVGEAKPATNRIVVATTVALSFISLWRAAAIVLNDLGSSMFYAGAVAEQAAGPAAPWLVLGVMSFCFALRSVYLESCSMFVRGGVYVVVRDALGSFVARLSVSALIFDFLLTGPISSVSAGQYIAGLLGEFFPTFITYRDAFSVVFALAVTLYFWRTNVRGMHESSSRALRIMQVVTVMVFIILVWSVITLLLSDSVKLPPLHSRDTIHLTDESLGWFRGTLIPSFTVAAVLIAWGHAFLAISGFETLAQVYREIAHPKMPNLKKASWMICLYALVCTGVITFLTSMIVPDHIRAEYFDNPIGGLVMSLSGPHALKIAFHAFVVVVGALMLSGAVNTSIIGANGVLNRVAEDGVILDTFRKPHPRYGTTDRLINLVVLLQIFTIVVSGGDVYLLGEAYAFGVVWSFFLKSLSVMSLRYQRHDQEYRTPMNVRLFGRELPIGLALITLTLFAVAVTNLISKRVATIYGVAFTIGFFVVFTVSERLNARKRKNKKALEQFTLEHQPVLGVGAFRPRPGCMLVGVREKGTLTHLAWTLDTTDVRLRDIVVVTVHPTSVGEGEYALKEAQYFTEYEQELFPKVVEIAEKAGKHVELLIVASSHPLQGLIQTAATLRARCLVTGNSARMDSNELARRVGLAWEDLPEPKHNFALAIISKDRPPLYVNLGPHTPRLRPEDVEAVHDLWLALSEEEGLGFKLHHRDIVKLALDRLRQDLSGPEREQVLKQARSQVQPSKE